MKLILILHLCILEMVFLNYCKFSILPLILCCFFKETHPEMLYFSCATHRAIQEGRKGLGTPRMKNGFRVSFQEFLHFELGLVCGAVFKA